MGSRRTILYYLVGEGLTSLTKAAENGLITSAQALYRRVHA